MSKSFYFKLAGSNIKKNSQTYFPYILTCIGTIMMYYIMHSIYTNPGLDALHGSEPLKATLEIGTYIIGIFSVIFLFYTNSFLIKRRKKELGLYNILGMEKKHIAKTMSLETLYITVISLVIGLVSGLLLSKLMFLLLLKLLRFSVPIKFHISIHSIVVTLILFGIIFTLTLLNNLRQIQLAKPIELLKGGQTGEREPKTKWVLTLIGVVSMGIGYYIAITTESPLSAISLFFSAVILVMIGTYALFTAGSIALLKILKKNKSYYYQTKHFINVSGMIYRMKQNAVGLANICILSTGVLLMLSTTVSLYIGAEDAIKNLNPRDIIIEAINADDQEQAHISQMIDDVLANRNVTPKSKLQFEYLTVASIQNNNIFTIDPDFSYYGTANIRALSYILLDDYNRIEHKSETLNENEIMICSSEYAVDTDQVTLYGEDFKIKKQLDNIFFADINPLSLVSNHYIVVKDKSVFDKINKLQASIYKNSKSNAKYTVEFNVDTGHDEILLLASAINEKVKDTSNAFTNSIAQSREGFYEMNGGFLFLGISLGALFIMATVLIIYYKQISEGYDDKERFAIMQKVGMSKKEIKKSIHSQILTVFFLPLVAAMLHITVAFKVMTRILILFGLTNTNLFIICTIGTIVVFAIFYAIVYSLTARVYYKIVK